MEEFARITTPFVREWKGELYDVKGRKTFTNQDPIVRGYDFKSKESLGCRKNFYRVDQDEATITKITV